MFFWAQDFPEILVAIIINLYNAIELKNTSKQFAIV